MANLIISDPSDRQMEKARALWTLAHPQRPSLGAMPAGVNTSVSQRMFEKRMRERPITPRDVAAMKLISWDTVAKKLSSLNDTIIYTALPDAKIAIGFRAPTHLEVSNWEKEILTPTEREEVRRFGNHQGPRPFLVPASKGHVAPYTTIMTDSYPSQIICRSLKRILSVLIAHGGFTWPQAERAFGFRLLGPGTEEKTERVWHTTPRTWAEERPSCRVN